MADALAYLTFFSTILIIGITCTILANRFNITRLLLLLVSGILIKKFNIARFFTEFDPVFMTSISILVLVMIVFDASSRYKLKEFDEISVSATKLVLIWTLLNILILTFIVKWFFGLSTFLAIIFALLMSGTSADVIVSILKKMESRIVKILEVESIISEPMIVLLPVMTILMMQSFQGELLPAFIGQVGPFMQQLVVGVGSGVVVGFVAFKSTLKYPDLLSPLSVMTTALLTYIVAENLGGSGILAIIVLGLLFGNMYIREKTYLTRFSVILADSLLIIVFILLGMNIDIPLSVGFFFKSIVLFIVYLIIRYIAISIALRKLDILPKEKIFMTLNSQKGIVVATVAFIFTTYTILQAQIIDDVPQQVTVPFMSLPGANELLSLVLVFMAYSMILSILMEKQSQYFIERKELKEDKKDEQIVPRKWFMFEH